LDLLAAGLIKDPMIGANIWDIRPYEGYQWCYIRRFPTPEFRQDQKVFLWFGGIDCLSDIWLNGTKVGSTENMLIEHSFDVTGLLEKDKDNELQVIIRSVVIEAQNYLLSALVTRWGGGTEESGLTEESTHIRKAPHMYGWNIMPRLVSAGLWRNVELRLADPVRFTDVHWMTTGADVKRQSAEILVDYQLKIPFDQITKCHAIYVLKRNGKEVYRHSQRVIAFAARHRFTLNDADLWWPRGYGEPALYEAELSIIDEKGNVLASDRKNIGLRTVVLDINIHPTPEKPMEFCFKVNSEKIIIKGTNWVPLDALHSRDEMLLSKTMEMAVDLNCNMLRCWGGNVYEDHAFFDLCDQHGILVWLDFSMACNVPPQTDDFVRKMKTEVTSVVLKLRNHPSIALWAGSNENDQFLRFGLDPNKDKISRQVIPEILFELDPTRSYLPCSPFLTQPFIDSGRQWHFLPEIHIWGPARHYKDPVYMNLTAHFVSELGYHGCPNRESLEKMFDKDCVYPWKKGTFEWNEQWKTKATRPHQHAIDNRNDIMLRKIEIQFGDVPTDLDQFIFASQAIQAEAKKFFVEYWRSAKFRRTGVLWWNLRDGWPIISDAIVDYYFGKKMAYDYVKRVQYDVCVMIVDERNNPNLPVIAVNDTRVEKQGTVIVKDIDTNEVVFSGRFSIPVNGQTTVGHIPQTDKQTMWLIEYTIGNEKFTNHYLAGKPPYKLKDYEEWYKKLDFKK